jgi:hypothetical protein
MYRTCEARRLFSEPEILRSLVTTNRVGDPEELMLRGIADTVGCGDELLKPLNSFLDIEHDLFSSRCGWVPGVFVELLLQR